MTDPTRTDKAWRLLHGATRTLVSGTGTLKERLRAAFTAEVMTLRPEHFPSPDLGARWDAVLDELAPNNRAHIALAPWWDFELTDVAREFVDIYDEVARHRPPPEQEGVASLSSSDVTLSQTEETLRIF